MRIGILLFLVFASGCATQQLDPFEPFNRGVQSFNDDVDRVVLKPIAQGYRWVLPGFAEKGVANFFSNLDDPIVALNQLLQGKPGHASGDFGRFLINSTLGIGGLFDVAEKIGLPKHHEDFGQTFSVWGIGRGAYLVIPLWGPSNPRDGLGDIVGSFGFAPIYLDDTGARNVLSALSIINKRATLIEAEDLVSGDRYAFIRDAYLQRREYLINDGLIDDEFVD